LRAAAVQAKSRHNHPGLLEKAGESGSCYVPGFQAIWKRKHQGGTGVKKDIPQLHFIRAIAMVGIFLHHLFQGIGPLRDAYAGSIVGEAFKDLALGVVVFNVMTAFLLALPFVGDNPKPIPKLKDFVPHRLSRLCPHYYIAVALVILGNAVVYRVTNPGDWLWPALSHLLFLDPLRTQAFMSNTAAYWWLGLLFQFTLAWPWILSMYRRHGAAGFTVTAALIAWPLTEAIKIWGRYSPDGLGGTLAFLSSFNLPSRLPEFLIGMWMAELWKRSPGRVWIVDGKLGGLIFGTCGVCTLLWLLGVPAPWFASLAWTLALFVLLFALPLSEKWGTRQGVLWLSGASYAIYLLHQPVLSYLDVAVASFSPWWKFAALGALGWLISVKEAKWLDQAAAWVSGKIGK
jgi:peptidoglycan/LPS O-acetylase OafA/YrhL